MADKIDQPKVSRVSTGSGNGPLQMLGVESDPSGSGGVQLKSFPRAQAAPVRLLDDAADRAATAPLFIGQIAVQVDTQTQYIANGTNAGDWVQNPAGNNTQTFANAAARQSETPDFAGQLGVQLDTGVPYVAVDPSGAGDWHAFPPADKNAVLVSTEAELTAATDGNVSGVQGTILSGTTVTVTHSFSEGEAVQVYVDTAGGDSLDTALREGTTYYIRDQNGTTDFALALTRGGAAITFSGDGSGTVYITQYRNTVRINGIIPLTLHHRFRRSDDQFVTFIVPKGCGFDCENGSLETDGRYVAGRYQTLWNWKTIQSDTLLTHANTVNTSNGNITIPGHGFQDGQMVTIYSPLKYPGGLATNTRYFASVVNVNNIRLRSTYNGADIVPSTNGSVQGNQASILSGSTVTVTHAFSNTNAVRLYVDTGGGDSLDTALNINNTYYIRDVVGTTSFKLANTSGGSAITFNGDGVGTIYFTQEVSVVAWGSLMGALAGNDIYPEWWGLVPGDEKQGFHAGALQAAIDCGNPRDTYQVDITAGAGYTLLENGGTIRLAPGGYYIDKMLSVSNRPRAIIGEGTANGPVLFFDTDAIDADGGTACINFSGTCFNLKLLRMTIEQVEGATARIPVIAITTNSGEIAEIGEIVFEETTDPRRIVTDGTINTLHIHDLNIFSYGGTDEDAGDPDKPSIYINNGGVRVSIERVSHVPGILNALKIGSATRQVHVSRFHAESARRTISIDYPTGSYCNVLLEDCDNANSSTTRGIAHTAISNDGSGNALFTYTNHAMYTGQMVYWDASGSGAPAGFTANEASGVDAYDAFPKGAFYWVIRVSDNTFKLASSLQNALDNVPVAYSAPGAATYNLFWVWVNVFINNPAATVSIVHNGTYSSKGAGATMHVHDVQNFDCPLISGTTVGRTNPQSKNYYRNGAASNETTVTMPTSGASAWTKSSHSFVTGDRVVLIDATGTTDLPGGFQFNTPYYLAKTGGNTFTLAATYGGTAITASSSATATTCSVRFGDALFAKWEESYLLVDHTQTYSYQ